MRSPNSGKVFCSQDGFGILCDVDVCRRAAATSQSTTARHQKGTREKFRASLTSVMALEADASAQAAAAQYGVLRSLMWARISSNDLQQDDLQAVQLKVHNAS